MATYFCIDCAGKIANQNTGKGRRRIRCKECQAEYNLANSRNLNRDYYKLKKVRDFLAGKVPFVEEIETKPLLDWPEELIREAPDGFQHHFHDSGTGVDRGSSEA